MANGERPLSAELLTERLARLAEELPEIRNDIREIRKAQEVQTLHTAKTCSMQITKLEALELRVAGVEADLDGLRRRVNGWNAGNTLLASVGALLSIMWGGGK